LEGHAARMVEMRCAYNFSVGKTEGKKLLGRSRISWEENIQVDLKEVGCSSVDGIYLTRDKFQWQAVVNTVMNFRVT